ncbi:hypothetical protein FOA52_000928 [Chlamydomonas sp. UWO 241]|nr:hypothetical protein FOA52_000928 [Chlamydomonas sp. UWO 241]
MAWVHAPAHSWNHSLCTMASLNRRDLRKLLLGPDTPANILEAAAGALHKLAEITDNQVAIATAPGVIPLLVQLLGPGSAAGNSAQQGSLQQCAAGILGSLAGNADNAVTIAAAGAVPPLVQLLGAGSAARVQHNAAAALELARNADNAVTIADAGAIPLLVQLLGACSNDATKSVASGALQRLGQSSAYIRTAIAAAGASANLIREMEGLGIGGPAGG